MKKDMFVKNVALKLPQKTIEQDYKKQKQNEVLTQIS